MFKSILIAVDGSDNNKAAVAAAVTLAKEQGAKLTALSVFDPGGYGNVAVASEIVDQSSCMDKLCASALEYVTQVAKDAGVEFTALTACGDPAAKIVEASKDFDLVICGTLGRTGFTRLIMGSVAEKVSRFASCPVLVYRQ